MLQRWSNEWSCFVDTTESEVADGDRVTIREYCYESFDGQQSKDMVRFLSVRVHTLIDKGHYLPIEDIHTKLF